MGNPTPFTQGANTVALSVPATSVNSVVATVGDAVVLTNVGPAVVFVVFSDTAAPVATTAGLPVLPGCAITVSKGFTQGFIGAIGASAGPSTLYVTVGYGN